MIKIGERYLATHRQETLNKQSLDALYNGLIVLSIPGVNIRELNDRQPDPLISFVLKAGEKVLREIDSLKLDYHDRNHSGVELPLRIRNLCKTLRGLVGEAVISRRQEVLLVFASLLHDSVQQFQRVTEQFGDVSVVTRKMKVGLNERLSAKRACGLMRQINARLRKIGRQPLFTQEDIHFVSRVINATVPVFVAGGGVRHGDRLQNLPFVERVLAIVDLDGWMMERDRGRSIRKLFWERYIGLRDRIQENRLSCDEQRVFIERARDALRKQTVFIQLRKQEYVRSFKGISRAVVKRLSVSVLRYARVNAKFAEQDYRRSLTINNFDEMMNHMTISDPVVTGRGF